jgi:iron complex outermembrane receptor protein
VERESGEGRIAAQIGRKYNEGDWQMKNIIALAVSALALTYIAHARAQQSGVTAGVDELETVVVTAQKRSQHLEDVPISIAVVKGEDLSASGVNNTIALRELVPGLNMSENGIYLQPTIRGITTSITNPGADSNVAIYLDDFYQPSQAGNVFDLPDVDRVEVLKGPQGTLFGRNATGGAIQVFTREPTFIPTGTLSASEGVYDVGGADTKFTGFVAGPLLDNILAASLSANYEKNDGYMRNLLYGDRLGYENYSIRGKLLLKLNDDAKFILGGSYSHRDDMSALALTALNGNISARAVNPAIVLPANGYDVIQNLQPHLESNAYSANLRGEFDTSVGQITSLTGWIYDNIYKNDADSDASPLSLVEFLNPSYSKSYSQEFNFASKWDSPLSMIAGANYFHDDSAYAPLIVLNTFSAQAKQLTSAEALFAELTYKWSDRWSLLAGLRYSDEHKHAYASVNPEPYSSLGEKSFTSKTPRASVNYKVADQSNVYFTYSSGFKSGLFDAIGFNRIPILPEKIDAFEVGFKTRATNYSFEAAAFYYNYFDLQVGALRGPIISDQNAGGAKIAGLDLNGTMLVAQDLRVHASLSYIPKAEYVHFPNADASVPITVSPITGLACTACGNADVAVDASGYRLIRTPKVSAAAGFTYAHRLGLGELGLSSNLYYSSAYALDVTGRTQQGSYVTLSSDVSWTLKAWRFSLWGRNLTDDRHIVVETGIGSAGDLVNYAPPLQVGVAVNYAF